MVPTESGRFSKKALEGVRRKYKYHTIDPSKKNLRPLLISLSVLLMSVVLLTYAWHRATRSQLNEYEEGSSLLILNTIVETIEDYTLIHAHAVTVAAKALTFYSELHNSSTNTALLDRLVVRLANF